MEDTSSKKKMEDTPAPPNFFPDDVLFEVLVRVAVTDVAALFRCAAACKRWCYPSSLCCRWPEGASYPSVLVGLFTQQWCQAGDQNDDRDGASPCAPPVFVPTARSAFGSGRRSLTSFVRGTAAGLLDGAKPLAARGGFLLGRLAPVTCGSDNIRLAACNVLAGTCDVLPPLENRSARIRYGYAILTGEDCHASNQSTRFFKVLAMGLVNNVDDREKLQCDLQFSTRSHPTSRAGGRARSASREPIDLCWRHCKEAVVCDGVVSWLYASMSYYNDNITYRQFSTIDVSTENGHLTLTKLSFPPPMILSATNLYRLAAVGGTVSLLCLHKKQGEKGFCKETWKQGDDIGGDWPCSRAMKLTGSGEAVADELWLLVTDVVPMEIDWPALIIARLARYSCHTSSCTCIS